jgi:ABC-type multidrug transport system fused ATPase/permease subunit
VIGLTGPSGAGKSTFVDVVAGLVQPSAGTVEIDGVPIDDINIRGWRRTIGYVAQDTLLLRASVRENIAWGEPTASEGAIEQAARLAHADHFICALPQGYETVIGDRGVRLSGGQRQRIGLARALLGDKRLLILDEATSALDSESEAKVLEAIESLRGRMTVIMVAHRLSTLRPCDRVLVFEDGRLVEVGGFAELIRQGGSFARLWHLQSQRNEAAAS